MVLCHHAVTPWRVLVDRGRAGTDKIEGRDVMRRPCPGMGGAERAGAAPLADGGSGGIVKACGRVGPFWLAVGESRIRVGNF
jgi:hypothetical protein